MKKSIWALALLLCITSCNKTPKPDGELYSLGFLVKNLDNDTYQSCAALKVTFVQNDSTLTQTFSPGQNDVFAYQILTGANLKVTAECLDKDQKVLGQTEKQGKVPNVTPDGPPGLAGAQITSPLKGDAAFKPNLTFPKGM